MKTLGALFFIVFLFSSAGTTAQELITGGNEVMFDGTGLASGVYFTKLEAEGYVETKSMMLLK